VTTKGRLVQLLTDTASANPRWLVTFLTTPWKDEELYERAFRTNEETTKKRNADGILKTSSSSSEAEEKAIVTPTKHVAFSESPSEADSPMTRDAKVSAREQRSMRRQIKEAEAPVIVSAPLPSRPPRNRSRHGHLPPLKKTKDNEDIIKVPMLSGTLIFYLGKNKSRRAEFVRKY
jgi:hypothetical protein